MTKLAIVVQSGKAALPLSIYLSDIVLNFLRAAASSHCSAKTRFGMLFSMRSSIAIRASVILSNNLL